MSRLICVALLFLFVVAGCATPGAGPAECIRQSPWVCSKDALGSEIEPSRPYCTEAIYDQQNLYCCRIKVNEYREDMAQWADCVSADLGQVAEYTAKESEAALQCQATVGAGCKISSALTDPKKRFWSSDPILSEELPTVPYCLTEFWFPKRGLKPSEGDIESCKLETEQYEKNLKDWLDKKTEELRDYTTRKVNDVVDEYNARAASSEF